MPLATVSLKDGANKIKIVGKGANFAVDYITLNSDVNYSAQKSLRYEAEQGALEGGCRQEVNAYVSDGKNVGYNYVSSTITFTVKSMVADEAFLSLRMSYWGDNTYLSEVLEITINGTILDLSAQFIEHTGGYEYYVDVFLNTVNVNYGDNTIVIKSLTDQQYNVDYLSLTNEIISSSAKENRYEAERAILRDGCQTEYYAKASGGQDVGYNKPFSNITFNVVAESEINVKLVLALSCFIEENGLMSDYLYVTINGQNLNIYDKEIISTGNWDTYFENYVGDVRLSQGLNIITITSKSETYNLDYIALTAK